jgi:peptidoglycan/xylan/chitin deacetylase (PgdA/CDA1 family)
MRSFRLMNSMASGFSISRLLHATNQQVIPVFYHAVGYAEKSPWLKGLYRVPTPLQFEQDIEILSKHLQPLDLETLIQYTNGQSLPKNKQYYFLSFDDGLKECSEFIAPFLQRKGIPATFFINPGFVEKEIRFHRFVTNLLAQAFIKEENGAVKLAVNNILGIQEKDAKYTISRLMQVRYNKKEILEELKALLFTHMSDEKQHQQAYMDKADIQNLIDAGFTIGAHGMDHPEYYLLNEEEQVQQTIESVKLIKKWFGVPYKVFAFPFTDVGVRRSFFARIQKEFPLDLTFGSSGLKKDTIKNHLQRIPLDDEEVSAEKRLKAELLYFLAKKPFRKNVYHR